MRAIKGFPDHRQSHKSSHHLSGFESMNSVVILESSRSVQSQVICAVVVISAGSTLFERCPGSRSSADRKATKRRFQPTLCMFIKANIQDKMEGHAVYKSCLGNVEEFRDRVSFVEADLESAINVE
jgi:hypothetical protein